jgi:hypothetical protein
MNLVHKKLMSEFPMDFDIIEILACVLTELCEKQDADPKQSRNKFSAQNVPGISLVQYLGRIDRYSQCSKECFVLALIYIDRIIQTNGNFLVNSYNIHRLLITAVMLAAKFFDDQYFNNTYYARVGGVDATEINQLEVEFLFVNNFYLAVPTETYAEYYTELRTHEQQNCAYCIGRKLSLAEKEKTQPTAATTTTATTPTTQPQQQQQQQQPQQQVQNERQNPGMEEVNGE